MLLVKLLACACITASVWTYDCPCGWESSDDTCYYFSDKQANWAEARTACRMRGGDLAVPTDGWTNNVIYQKMKSKGIGSAWLGIVRIWNMNFYSICGIEVSYTRWYTGEPNNFEHTENCVELLHIPQNKKMNSYWNDQSCTDMLHYVCELHHPRCLK